MRWASLIAMAAVAAGGMAACSGGDLASSGHEDAGGADGTARTDGGRGHDASDDDASGHDASGGDDQGASDAPHDGNSLDSTQDAPDTGIDAPFDAPDGSTACDLPAVGPNGGTYVVDPANGSDTLGTGSGTKNGTPKASCAFKTITHAIAAIAAIGTPEAGASFAILVAAGSASAASGESFPLVVPAQTLIQGATNLGSGINDTTVINASATDTFVLTNPGASLQALTLDGQNVATDGVVIGPAGTFTVTQIEPIYFTGAGVRVGGTAQANLTDVNAHNDLEGVYVTDQATASFSEVYSLPIHDNVNDGVLVDSGGSINMTICSKGCWEMYVNGNGRDGVRIVQTGASPPLNVLGPIVLQSNGGAGLYVGTGSAVRARSVEFAGNAVGLHVAAAPGATNLSVAGIDLGTDPQTDMGYDAIQAPSSNPAYHNTAAGLCVDVPGGSGVLQAQGDAWSDLASAMPVDCYTGAGGVISLVTGVSDCSQGGGADIVMTAGTGDTVNTTICTQTAVDGGVGEAGSD